MSRIQSVPKILFTAGEVRLNGLFAADLESREKSWRIEDKYIYLKYYFREGGIKEYLDIWSGNDYNQMARVLRDLWVWEDHIVKCTRFNKKFGYL